MELDRGEPWVALLGDAVTVTKGLLDVVFAAADVLGSAELSKTAS